ncbi:MAG: glycosyltransferase family 39 protein [Acidimicrobiia bacterium]
MRRLRGTLAIVVAGAVGAVVRIAYAIDNVNAHTAVDSQVYRRIASHLVNGDGYVIRDYATGLLVPTASHPPAFPFVLAGLDVVGLTSKLQQRIPLAIVASVGVVLTGFVARHVAGNAAGTVAAFIAALHPLWFQYAGVGVSESLYLVVVPLLLLVAVRAADRPTWQRMAIVGAVAGVVSLSRSEGTLFFVVLVVPLALVVCPTWKQRLAAILVATAALLVVITPWLVRNYREFDGLTMSTNQGVTLAGSWCDSTLTKILGGWDLYCVIPARDAVRAEPPPPGHDNWDELAVDRELTSRAIDYARHHLRDIPRLVAARIGRTFGVYSLDANDVYGELVFDVHEGRDRGAQRVGQILHLLLLPFAIYGAVRLTRRYLPVLLAGPIVAAISASVFYGSTRMRVSAEPAIAVLAAVGIVALADVVRRRRGGASPDTGTDEDGATGVDGAVPSNDAELARQP